MLSICDYSATSNGDRVPVLQDFSRQERKHDEEIMQKREALRDDPSCGFLHFNVEINQTSIINNQSFNGLI